MRIYKKQNVYDAAIERITWLFQEFEEVIVSVSGGKDSTICFELTMQIAKKLNRLPLKVLFIDQEAEWNSTIEQIKYWMYDKDVEPYWLQVPIKLFNATSDKDGWLYCWDPAEEDKWIHPHDPVSIKENIYKTDRFHQMFRNFVNVEFKDKRVANVSGVRGEESPNRLTQLTHLPVYKWATWGSLVNREAERFSFFPLYDWSYSDVWKAIHDNGWKYNTLYDSQYQYGVSVRDMRVSNVHHETAVQNLFYLQEVEPETYAKLTRRLDGIDTAGKLGADDYFVYEVPFMFDSWKEYRSYLLENLIEEPQNRRLLQEKFDMHDRDLGEVLGDRKYQTQINSILTHDYEGIKMHNLHGSQKGRDARRTTKMQRTHVDKL